MNTKLPPAGPLVCVLAYEGLCTFEFGICVEVFALARPELDVPWYRFAVVSAEKGPVSAAGGITVTAQHDLSALRSADLVLIPGWCGPREPVPLAIRDALRDAHGSGARIAAICSGVFVLAAAGLLLGRRATTHWRYIEALRLADASIQVEADVLYVDEGDVLTSAGSAAGLDLCLHIVRKDYGAEAANSVARRLVLPAHRDGGQAQFIPRPVARPHGGQIAPLLDILRRRLDEAWNVERMAAHAGMSSRTLLRRFKDATGDSPQTWLACERVSFARELLETTNMNSQSVAERAGFGSVETLRHHFRRLLSVSPQAYRTSFSARLSPD